MTTIARPLMYAGLAAAAGAGTTAFMFEAAKNPDLTKKILYGTATGVGTVLTAAGAIATHNSIQQYQLARTVKAEAAAAAEESASAAPSTSAPRTAKAATTTTQSADGSVSKASPAKASVAAQAAEQARQASLAAKAPTLQGQRTAPVASKREKLSRAESDESDDDLGFDSDDYVKVSHNASETNLPDYGAAADVSIPHDTGYGSGHGVDTNRDDNDVNDYVDDVDDGD